MLRKAGTTAIGLTLMNNEETASKMYSWSDAAFIG
jgi:hypothetical protein